MRTLIGTLMAATLIAMTAPAHAADLLTPLLRSSNGGGGHMCSIMNKGTTNITVTLQIVSPDSDLSPVTCGPFALYPKDGTSCFFGDNGFGNTAYCKVTTSNAANTRAILMVLGGLFQAVAATEAK